MSASAALETASPADDWMKSKLFVQKTGINPDEVSDNINDGHWIDGVHYKRTGPRTLWINRTAVNRWVMKHKSVEATQPPQKR